MTPRTLRLALCIPLLLTSVACKGRHGREVQNEEPQAVVDNSAPVMTSIVRMSDKTAPAQLLKGFYGLEGGVWRWTAGSFDVLLRPPAGAAERGATLSFAFTIPEVVSQKLGAVTLTASIDGTKLKSESYAKPGSYTFRADVAPAQLAGDKVTIAFALDKKLASGALDQRELGLIATSVGLESK